MLETMFFNIFIVKCTMPIGPKVVQLAVFTHSVYLIMSTLSEIFVKCWYKVEEHVVPVSNKAIIG